MSSHPLPQYARSQQTAIVRPTTSSRALLAPLGMQAVRLTDHFWEPRRMSNHKMGLQAQLQQSEQTGRIDNFRRAAGLIQAPFQGIYFNDSDVYKWVEACAWVLATEDDSQLAAQVDEVIALIAAAQDEDGYLNTYFTFERKAERWTNLKDMHELYCAGHLIQAAIAYHRATGKTTLLDVAVRFADNIAQVFGPQGRPGACGHPEIEMALVELARETGNERYLQQAEFFVDQHGRKPPVISGSYYMQDHLPVREQTEVVGHAVRALYLYAGMTDILTETGEQALDSALETLWHNLVEEKTYITGGVGARWEGEAFGSNYELPNDRAYTETCAAIASVMWNWRLLLLKSEARFADTIEQALYNGVISGSSLDGTLFFYQNPLADRGQHRRQPWFPTACCPPNIARLLASLPGYFYSTSEEGLWVHFYANNTATATLASGHTVMLEQETSYPWDGEVMLRVQTETTEEFTLFVRIPGWAEGARAWVNQEEVADVQSGSYLALTRVWSQSDEIRLSFPMDVKLVESHPFVAGNHDCVAIMRGPLVYCVEQADHGNIDVWNLVLPVQPVWEIERRDDLLGGVVTLQAQAYERVLTDWGGQLYRTYRGQSTHYRSARLTAIPYYAWANRETGPMQVWLPVVDHALLVD
ncbi:hypothetical protein KSF_018870 [Reticulibacter mediterranei]|uniref:Glycoside hydrolase family 127 protein n=1 Tax=Reticulibacter mediterranei TaxID=2778369 RepID=A0A8J3MYA9_9CHLR|nr:beta-L-arabinofuranosidase domain-containing protein [Reticulibacter mediterranei]GHO91839.1 hypothetical protein KSF_018870 [Reticulibacter mediterranei]